MRRIHRTTLLAALASSTPLTGCISNAPRIADPQRIDSFCPSSQARPTGVASVMTSTDDKLLPGHPTAAGIRREVKSQTGVIEYWNVQLLALPNVSKQLGETDGYVRVRAVAVPIAEAGTTTRTIYLDLLDHGYARWVAMRAYDVQNVCVEGRREA